MGKKRIKTIDLSKEESKKPKAKGRIIVKSGKQHGRIADIGAMMLREMEKRKEVEKKDTSKVKSADTLEVKEAKARKKKIARPPKARSQRYKAIKKLIKGDKSYPLSKAIELLKKCANAKFDESVELHLTTYETGVFTKGIKTEKKLPLAHVKIGKTSWPKKKLEENIQSLIKAIGVNKIKKAVLTSTMGPGIKINLDESVS